MVQGGQVASIGPGQTLRQLYPQAEVVEAVGQAIVPGLVNAHHHMYGVLAHGIPLPSAPAGFWPFLRDFWWPQVEDALDHQMIAAATDLACLEMVKSGVTTFYDCLEAPQAIPGALEVEAAVVRRWGLRGLLSFESTERCGTANGELGLRENVEFIDSCRQQGGLVQGMMCFHTSFTCSASFIRRAVALAQERQVMVHMHLAEGRHEPEYCLAHFGQRPVAYYDRLGVLGPWTLASQCVQVDSAEIALLAQRGARAVHMPMSNCEVGGGIAPVPEMLAAGVTLGLGSDGYVSNFLENMRWAFLVHKARLQDPTVMPAAAVWQMATAGGAIALGLSQVGALHPGHSADLVLMRTDLPTPVTGENLREQLLLWGNPADITAVLVAGRWLMRDGIVLGADEAAIRAQCREAARKLWGMRHK
ncbi:MAG: amidohydrolase family protein [Chloroflexi bacterium]|nr:amidohydrolase family protein [Chloroflexota bacterium]